MNRLVTCLVAVLAVSARGSGVRADGPATYDLGRKDVWKAGDVVTETIAESEDQGYTFSVPGGAAPKKETRASKTGVSWCGSASRPTPSRTSRSRSST